MYTCIELINLLKVKHNLKSDYAAAKLIGVSPQAIAHITKNKGTFSVVTTTVLAELLDLDTMYAIACVQYDWGVIHNNENVKNSFSKFLIAC